MVEVAELESDSGVVLAFVPAVVRLADTHHPAGRGRVSRCPTSRSSRVTKPARQSSGAAQRLEVEHPEEICRIALSAVSPPRLPFRAERRLSALADRSGKRRRTFGNDETGACKMPAPVSRDLWC